jgi:2-polyprenyl-3-methyl-5-hydroxy-6-metoxy-1,4-benzoquinol methylase
MCIACKVDFNQSQADAFAEKMLGILNQAAVALMASVGHRTGLFDALSKLPPATSQDVASAAGLQERYVREWLGAMVTSGIVEYDPAKRQYRLPPEHAAYLTRSAMPNNLASVAQWIPVLGQVEDRILEVFEQGGGVPYAAYNRFHQVMAEESGQTVVFGLLEHILPLVPGIREQLEQGIDVLDVGCGSGWALCLMAKTFPHSRFTGIDMSQEAIQAARTRAEEQGLRNVQFHVRDAARLNGNAAEMAGAFDLITAFDAIHDQADPAGVLRAIARGLRPGGTFLMQDIRASSHLERNADNPLAPFIFTVSCLHCMTVSLAQGGAGLGAAWGEDLALRMLAEAGFGPVVVKRLEHDIMNNYYIVQGG